MPFSNALVWCLEFNNVFRFPINLLHLEVIVCVLITLSLTFAKNRFKISTLAAFLKDFLPLQKNEKCNLVPQFLNKNSCQFYAFKNKMDSSQKIANFKLRITLLQFQTLVQKFENYRRNSAEIQHFSSEIRACKCTKNQLPIFCCFFSSLLKKLNVIICC